MLTVLALYNYVPEIKARNPAFLRMAHNAFGSQAPTIARQSTTFSTRRIIVAPPLSREIATINTFDCAAGLTVYDSVLRARHIQQGRDSEKSAHLALENGRTSL